MEIKEPIAVLGYGQEGKELETYFRSKKTAVSILDEKIPGKNDFHDLSRFHTIFRSPGIPYLRKEIQEALQKGVMISSLTKLFFDLCPCPIIGVTGTKGKGTTATLIYQMLKAAGKDVYLGGNIGYPPLKFLHLLNKNGLVILELSSFQLQDLHKSPHVAVVLNVTSDHLDYHKDVEEYLAAKEAIVKFQKPDDIAIFNADYPYKDHYFPLTPAKKYFTSLHNWVKKGAYVESSFLRSEKRFSDTSGWTANQGDPIIYQSSDIQPEIVIGTAEIGLLGRHNLENALPAITVAKLYNVPLPVIQKVLREFKGNPHRLEFVREVNGVKYYNDSASTTPETSLAAAQAFQEPTILIAGGSEKNADYKMWGFNISDTKVQSVVLIGQTANKMAESIRRSPHPKEKPKIEFADSLKEAVRCARAEAKPGWNVIFSPGAASFDMFKNYQERGEQFKALVAALE